MLWTDETLQFMNQDSFFTQETMCQSGGEGSRLKIKSQEDRLEQRSLRITPIAHWNGTPVL